MLKSELLKRTPLRILDQNTNGGLQAGDVGVLAAPKGVGKTACLVHIATIQLLEEKHVVHLTFSDDTAHIVSWYETIFDEVARRHSLDGVRAIHDETVKNRVIVNFRKGDNPVAQLEKSLELLEENASFHADTLVVDGFDFSQGSVAELQELRRYAANAGYAIWMSASTPQGSATVPEALAPFMDEIAILVGLEDRGDHVHLELLKDHGTAVVSDMHLALDTKTLLITEEAVAV